MNKRINIVIGFSLFSLALLVSFLLPKSTSAEIKGQGLTISPPITEISLKPGETSTQTIRLTNPTGKNIEVYPKVMNFRDKGESGEPAFFDASDETAKFSLAQWITFTQPKIVLTPEQFMEFKYTITIPQDAEPGGHYGVMFFASDPPKSEDAGTQVTLSSMLGSLVLVKVPGQISEKAVLEDFNVSKKFSLTGDINFATRLSNIGNVHVKPKGTIKLKGWFGAPDKLTFNEQGGNVLPDSIRKFDNNWKPGNLRFGLYTADLNLVYGDSEKTIQKNVSFWLIPWWLIMVISMVVTMIIFVILFGLKQKSKRPLTNKGL